MPKVELIETAEPATEESLGISQSAGSFLVSVLFWLSLLISAGIYASVALSPKAADWIRVRQQFLSNAVRLKQLDDEVDYHERVVAALRSDPEFARRLVKMQQNPEARGEDFVPVSDELLFGGGVQSSEKPPEVIQPAIAGIVFHLASHREHRNWLLTAAAALTLLAFTLLNEAGVETARAVIGGTRDLLLALAARYRKPKTEAAEASEDEISEDE